MAKRMTQTMRVLRYMKEYGSISPVEAFWDLGVTKLTNQIGYLEKEGIKVYRVYSKGLNRFNEPVYYMRYFLDEKKYIKYLKESNMVRLIPVNKSEEWVAKKNEA